MYGAPSLLKQWIDLVLEYGWAHGEGGAFLKDKLIFNTLTTGGSRAAYATTGVNRFSIGEFLISFQQTATLCRMVYLPPFTVQGTYHLTDADLSCCAALYGALLNRLIRGEFDIQAMKRFSCLNDWLNHETGEGVS